MPYTDFDDSKPVATDNGVATVDAIRNNLLAMRDSVIMGFMPGWSATPSGGTNEQPAQWLYSKGTERLRASITWGTTGGADGNPTQVVWEYSSDSGSTWDTVSTQSIVWNSDGTPASFTT